MTAKKQSDTSLDQKLEQLQAEVAEKEEAHRRVLADYQNVVKRSQDEKRQWLQVAVGDLVSDLLPSFDHLQLAVAHFPDPSLKMIVGEMERVLQQHGLQKMETVGDPFDALTMEAVDTAPGEKDIVVSEQLAGYRLNGKVIRHAQVIVGNGEES
jgi:molecular chaperone GrpE